MKKYRTPKIIVKTIVSHHIMAGSLDVNEKETDQMLSKRFYSFDYYNDVEPEE